MEWKASLLVPPAYLFPILPIITTSRNEGENELNAYPITLYSRDNHGKITWIGFIFAFFYTTKDGSRKLRLESPLCFLNESCKKPLVYGRLLDEVEELARSGKCKTLEIECYTKKSGKITFPSTLSLCSGFNYPEIKEYLIDDGFEKKFEEYCYELDAKTVTSFSDLNHVYDITSIDEERSVYWDMWRESLMCPVKITDDQLNQPLNHGIRLLSGKDYVLSLRKNGEIIGVSHWFPDFYPLIKKHRGVPKTALKLNGKRGKIFKVLTKNKNSKIFRALICGTVRVMLKNGISSIQIGNIRADDNLNDVIRSLNGKQKHILWYMEKKLQ